MSSMEKELQIQYEGNSLGDAKEKQLSFEESLAKYMPSLSKAGGMNFLGSLVHNVEMMDPRKKASYNIFLSDSLYVEARKELSRTLGIWIDLLSNQDCDTSDKLVDFCNTRVNQSQDKLAEDLENIHKTIRELEISYRTIDTFFRNTEMENVNCLHLVNVDKKNLSNEDGLTDTKSYGFQFIQRKLHEGYDTIDLRQNYSLLVLPNYFAYKGVKDERNWSVDIRTWAHLAHENKVLLITDFEDCTSFNELIERLEKSNVQDTDADLSSVVMTCTYLLGRRKSDIADEYEDLYIPSSAALAGKMANTAKTKISQSVAGQQYGCLNGGMTVRFNLLKSELSLLIDKGVVPMIEVDGHVIAFSNSTLYDGPIQGLQEYPIIRVFDWVSKVIQHLCHEHALIIWDSNLKEEMKNTLNSFLEKYKGPGKLYENFILKEPQQDSNKNIVVKLEIKPFFAAKNFLIELSGKNENNSMKWQQEIKSQEIK